jgi:hypothetical protein
LVKASNKNAPPVRTLDLPLLDDGLVKTNDTVDKLFFNIVWRSEILLVCDTFSPQDRSDPTRTDPSPIGAYAMQ